MREKRDELGTLLQCTFTTHEKIQCDLKLQLDYFKIYVAKCKAATKNFFKEI